jgi:hypothetical protein
MDVETMFESRFIKATDLGGKEWTLAVAAVRLETLSSKFGPERVRGIVTLSGAKKEWVLNRTNAECLRGMWGRETDGWIGKRVTLHAVPLEGDLAIRVLGSPDLEAPLDLEVKLPRKRPFTMRLIVTASAPAEERRDRGEDEHSDEAGERHERLGPSPHAAPFRAAAAAPSTPRTRQDPQPWPPTTRPASR